MMHSIISLNIKQVIRKLLAFVFWIAVWQIAAMIVGQELLIPAPQLVLEQLIELGATALFWQSAAGTLLRIFVGFLLGVLLLQICCYHLWYVLFEQHQLLPLLC